MQITKSSRFQDGWKESDEDLIPFIQGYHAKGIPICYLYLDKDGNA
jgi:hypothetical protein